jgi:hypothetical protein
MRRGPVGTWSAQALKRAKRGLAEINRCRNVAAKQSWYDD